MMHMKWHILLLFLISNCFANAKSVFTVDTMTYSINLDIKENAHLKNLPELILTSYVKGNIHAYYPKREMNEILLDDFLAHYGKANFNCGPAFCWGDYAEHAYLKALYDKFKKELRYREVIWYDAMHAVVKREVIWLQLVYSETDYNGDLKNYGGPKFWMMEMVKDKSLMIPNENNRARDWSIRQEFEARHFVPNEVGKEKLKHKTGKMDDANEN